MRELSINYPKKQEDEDKIAHYNDKYMREIEPAVKSEMQELQFGELNVRQQSVNRMSFCSQLKLLNWRNLRIAKREPRATFAKVIIAIFYGALYDMIWWQIGGKYDMSNILNMAGLTFTILVGQLMGNMFGAILTF